MHREVMNMERTQRQHDRERGSALLLSLGILSLVLILAMGFAFSANTNLSIARVQGNATNARSFADDVINKTLADMTYIFENTKVTGTDAGGNPTELEVSGLYPAEDFNKGNASAANLNQHVLVFNRMEVGTQPVQNLIYSRNLESSVSLGQLRAEQYYLGRLLGVAERTAAGEEAISTGDELGSVSWYGYMDDDFEGKLYELPVLRPLLGQVLTPTAKLDDADLFSFAPPVTITYKRPAEGGDEDVTEVVGRYAFLILEEGNKIDINSAISLSGYVPGSVDNSSHEIYAGGKYKYNSGLSGYQELTEMESLDAYIGFNLTGTALPTGTTHGPTDEAYAEDATFRLGLLPEEIQVNDAYVDNLVSASANNSVMGWLSYRQMAEKLAGGDNSYLPRDPSADTKVGDLFVYTFFGLEDIEAYWDETETGDVKEVARFDLTGSSWGMALENDMLPTGMWDQAKGKLDVAKTAWGRYPADAVTTPDNAKSCELVRQLCGFEAGTTGLDVAASALPAAVRGKNLFWTDANRNVVNYPVKAWSVDGDGYLQWLRRMADDDGNWVGLQVAANLKDYSDADDFSTYESKTGAPTLAMVDGSFPEVRISGNERVSYINEVLFKGAFDSSLDGATGAYDYTLHFYAGVEMLNLYCSHGSGGTGDCDVPVGKVHVKVKGEVKAYRQDYESVEETAGSGVFVTREKGSPVLVQEFAIQTESETGEYVTFKSEEGHWAWGEDEATAGGSTSIAKKHLGYNGLFMRKTLSIPEDLQTIIDTANATEPRSRFIFKFEVTDVQVVSFVDDATEAAADEYIMNHLYDVVSFGTASYHDDLEANRTVQDGNHDPFADLNNIVVFQCKDARCNHLRGEKTWSIKHTGEGTAPENTVLADNVDDDGSVFSKATVTQGTSVDWETGITFAGSAPKTYSTAYIRNAPMETLWELGAIHRGYPNQTINLKRYADVAADSIVAYSDGDAGILDQVKIGPLLFVKGKINANNRNGQLWEELLCNGLQDARYCWYDNTTTIPDHFQVASSAEKISIDKTGKFANELTAWTGAKTSSISRVEILAKVLENTVVAQNDRDYEAFIGKTAQLLTTRTDAYSMLFIAETLKDLQLTSTEYAAIKDSQNNLVKVTVMDGTDSEEHYCTPTGRQKVLVHVVRDAWRNEFKVVKKKYLED